MPRRLAITGPYRTEILSYQDPPLQPHQVLVRTELASGKHGTTLALFEGGAFAGQRFDESLRLFVDSDEPPRLPTRESPWGFGTTGVGRVADVGPAVTRWRPGDHVFGPMDVRETNVCPEDTLWALEGLEAELALCLEPAYVAFHAVREAGLRYGDSVAVIGLGALGLLAVRMARESGAETLIGVDPLPKRRALAGALGADHVLDPGAEDAALAVHRLTEGAGVDVAIELSGAYPALQTAIRCARLAGTVCSAGFYQGEARGLWLGREWHHNRLSMVVPHGCGWGHPPRDYPRWDRARALGAIVSLMRKGRLGAAGLIDPVVPFDAAGDIFALIDERPDKVIKVAVSFDAPG